MSYRIPAAGSALRSHPLPNPPPRSDQYRPIGDECDLSSVVATIKCHLNCNDILSLSERTTSGARRPCRSVAYGVFASSSPPFPFPPPGASRGGRVPPTPQARAAPASSRSERSPPPGASLARPVHAAPPTRGAAAPLVHPPAGLRAKTERCSVFTGAPPAPAVLRTHKSAAAFFLRPAGRRGASPGL